MQATSVHQHYVEYKDTFVAYLLWFFLGFLGVHRFYLNDVVGGVIWLFTGALCGLGWIIDICLIPGMVESENQRLNAGRQTIVVTNNSPQYMPPQFMPQQYPQQNQYSPQNSNYNNPNVQPYYK
ncbi:2 TM domain-containing transmembrane protein [Acrasis kona]|uniref:2 TM domain-containing transmembrane protein n=1 Tax=Acrasis kona TaxID=1008807 RepID=A0AAW2ZER1_9EUKA